MKTKRFRLLTVILAAVMMFALSVNVFAAKSNAVTKDGLTAQLFTDKDSYKAGESVKANVQVDNHTGKKVYVITQMTAPDGVVLENANVAFDAFLETGESWEAVGGVVTPNGNATGATATTGSTTATGDNMQAGFWVILTAFAVCGLFVLFVYGKNRTTWLSVMLCIAMVGGMVVAAVPAQAAGVEGSISLSCIIKVDGEDEVISATVSYMSYEEDVEDTDDTAEAATPSEPSQESSEPSQESSEPSQESSEPSQESSEPSQESSESSQEPSEPSQESSEPEAVVDTIYVSASATVGEGDGSINNPFANIDEAQACIREIKDAGKYPEKGITVYFREGRYRIDETIAFEAADSGEKGAPITYRAYDEEAVVFVGGIDIALSEFTAVTDTEVMSRLAQDTSGSIKQLDLKALGIDYGEMNVYGHSASYFPTAGIEIPETQPLELFSDGDTTRLARYPNEGWVYIQSVQDPGSVIQNWTKYAGGNDFIPEDKRDNPPKCPIFTVDATTKARMARWSKAEEPWVYGYWKETWSDQSMPVANMDVETGTIKTGVPSGKKITAGMYFYFYNLLEELDAPGEYYINRKNGMLYYYPTEDNRTVFLSLLKDNMVTFAEGTHDIDFVGIEFKAGRNHAFTMDEVERINIQDCDISGFANKAVYMADSKDVTIKGCHLYDLGKGGINVTYDTSAGIGLEMLTNLENMGIVVENCEINNFSRIQETYSPAVTTAGVGMIVRNCKIYDSNHLAIQLYGNDTLIENNEIFDVLQTSTDSGVFYVGFTKEQMGVVIRNNYIHDIKSSAGEDISVVYCDDTKDGVTAESNLIVNFAGRAVKFNGGWDNKFMYNVLINTPSLGSLSSMGMRDEARFDVETASGYAALKQVYSYPAYLKYPHWGEKLQTLLENNAPMYNTIKGNVIINVGKDLEYSNSGSSWSIEYIKRDNPDVEKSYIYNLSEVGLAYIENELYEIDENGEVLGGIGDLSILENSVLFEDIDGFKAYDFSKIGLLNENVDKSFGVLGPLVSQVVDSNLPELPLMDEFNTLEDWVHANVIPATSYVKVNDGGQLEIGMTGNGGINMDKKFAAHTGKVSYELDFMVNRSGSTDIDPGVVIARGTAVKDGQIVADQSIINVKVYNDAINGNVFGAYDGTGEHPTTTACEDNVWYKVKLVVDPETDRYDLYVKESTAENYGEPIIEGSPLRYDAVSFDGARISTKRAGSGNTPTMYYDNLNIQVVNSGEQVLPEGYLLSGDFSIGDTLDNWTTAKSGDGSYIINSNEQLQIELGCNSSSAAVTFTRYFDAYAGDISYEFDLMIERGGNPGGYKIIPKGDGSNEAGQPVINQSLVNIQIDVDADKKFSVYDGNRGRILDKECEDDTFYKIKLVAKLDGTYDLYIKEATEESYGNPVVENGKLRINVTSFTGIYIESKKTSGVTAATKVYLDNLVVEKYVEPIPTPQ